MKRLCLLLFTLVLMGVLFSCQTTSNYEEQSSNDVAVASEPESVNAQPEPAKVEEEPAQEPAKVEEPQVAEEVEDADDAEEVVTGAHKPGDQSEIWRITRAQVTWNNQVLASSETIPSKYQELEYSIIASETEAVTLDVSGTNVAHGNYNLTGNKISVRVEYIDWDVVRMVENYYGVDVQEGLLDAYYFFVEDFTDNTAILRAYALDRVLTIWATRQ